MDLHAHKPRMNNMARSSTVHKHRRDAAHYLQQVAMASSRPSKCANQCTMTGGKISCASPDCCRTETTPANHNTTLANGYTYKRRNDGSAAASLTTYQSVLIQHTRNPKYDERLTTETHARGGTNVAKLVHLQVDQNPAVVLTSPRAINAIDDERNNDNNKSIHVEGDGHPRRETRPNNLRKRACDVRTTGCRSQGDTSTGSKIQ